MKNSTHMTAAETVAHLRDAHGWNDASIATLAVAGRTVADGHDGEHNSGAPLGHTHDHEMAAHLRDVHGWEDEAIYDAIDDGRDLVGIHDDGHTKDGDLAHLYADLVRVTARVTPQVWSHDVALPVAAPGADQWDATAYARTYAEYIRALLDGQGGSPVVVVDCDEYFVADPAAPRWLVEWDGPFTIDLTIELTAELATDRDGSAPTAPLGACARCDQTMYAGARGYPIDAGGDEGCRFENLPAHYEGETGHLMAPDPDGLRPPGRCNGCGNGLRADNNGGLYCGAADCSKFDGDFACAECDVPAAYDGDGTVRHMFGLPRELSWRLDEDHVPYEDISWGAPVDTSADEIAAVQLVQLYGTPEDGKTVRVTTPASVPDELTPTQRQVAIEHVQALLHVSKRRAAMIVDTRSIAGAMPDMLEDSVRGGATPSLLSHVIASAVRGRGHDLRSVSALLRAAGAPTTLDTLCNTLTFGAHPEVFVMSTNGAVHARGAQDTEPVMVVPDANPLRTVKALRRLL
jgi:hypothetical protein